MKDYTPNAHISFSYTNGTGFASGNGNGDGADNGDNYEYDTCVGYGCGGGFSDGAGELGGHGECNGDGDGGRRAGYVQGAGDGEGNPDSCHFTGYGSLIYVEHDTPIGAWWQPSGHKHFGQPLGTTQGAIHEWPYVPEFNRHGLHASWQIADAIQNKDGTLYPVYCSGWVRFDKECLVCTRRVILNPFGEERRQP